jgi:hypothetical protein
MSFFVNYEVKSELAELKNKNPENSKILKILIQTRKKTYNL